MNPFKDPLVGIETPLGQLSVQHQQDGWTVLQNSAGDHLSFRFNFHFFSDLQQITAYMQNEIQQIANGNDLAGEEGLQQPDDSTVMAVYYQYIDNVSHLVVMAARLLNDRPGIFYMGVTKSESMADACRQLFLSAAAIAIEEPGKKDLQAEGRLAGQMLRYMDSYTSNTYGGGGTSTEKSFSLFADRSFSYSFTSVVSMGGLGGGTSRNQGFGTWEIRKDGPSLFLVLRWHLGNTGIFRLEWGQQGIVFLDGERYLPDNL